MGIGETYTRLPPTEVFELFLNDLGTTTDDKLFLRQSLDFDVDGEARLTSLRTSDTVPTPTAVLSTSLGKCQIFCRIDSFSFEQQESALKLFAIPFGGDRTGLDCNRVLRLSGFRNCKSHPSHPIPVTYPCDSTSNLGDCRLDIPAANALPLPHAIPSRKHPGKHTNSEHDWAWILHKLARGKDAAKLTRTIASRRSDKPRPLYLRPADGQCRISQTLPQRRSSDGGHLSRCWRSAPAPRLPLRGVSEKAEARDAVEPPAKQLTAGVESGASMRVLEV
jgi:RepB DNA-primase from phage plasmid